jgi:tetratricopeptide (TPR) repeat protein
MLRAHLRRKALGTAVRACALAVAVAVLTSMSRVQAAETCAPVIATVVSIQGGVELRRSPAGRSQQVGWQTAELNVALCAGDTIRTHERSRAALLLTNETTLRLDQRTTLTLAAPAEDKASLLDLAAGALHVITRTSRPFKVRTPFVNANVEGTEFLVAVGEESASVAVYEGRVTADNERGSVALTSGERAIAARNSAPRKEVVVRPRDAVQWTLYFPTIFDYRLGVGIAGAPGEAALRESIELYRKGKLADAIARLDSVPEGSRNPRFLIYRAGLLLLVGRLDEAKPNIERALALDPRNSDAYSLQAVIAVVENDKDLALSLANKAVELEPASPTARIALSYAQQSQFKIEQARASVQKAVDLDPQNALAWARLAELEMSAGNLDRALDAARHAAELNPQLAKTQTVLGFAYLTRIDTQAAKAAFEKAIELDNADPLARLGLGLAKIREGDLEGGRREIEIATSLDPETSLIRSYLGKAYYEERRDKLAGTQFDLAKRLDPRDPTPWFYDAIRKQTENRSVEALEDLEKSLELNDDRAVNRSRLLLDEDRATRSTGLARIYQDLGFEQLAVMEGAKALAADPGNYSAHLFLADAYSPLPRHEIARESEQLQFLLRQPEILAPVSPLRAQDTFTSAFPRAGIVRGVGPVQPAFNEFNSLFDRNKLSLFIDGLGGQRNTGGDQIIVSGIHNSLSFNVGQAHFETEGFGENQDFRQDAYIGIVQARLNPATSVQAEVRQTETERGDFISPFDPNAIAPVRLNGRVQSGRIGANHSLNASSDVLISAIYQTRNLNLTFPSFDNAQTILKDRSYSGELQWHYSSKPFYVVAGAGYLNGSEEFVGIFKQDISAYNVYIYGELEAEKLGLKVQGGLSANSLDETPLRKRPIDPKLGLIWTPTADTTVRAAAMRTLKRPLIANQTLEPTQVAGFNQFFDHPDGTEDSRYGAALDQRVLRNGHVGFEVSRSKMKVPVLSTDSVTEFDWSERMAKAYVYWALPRNREGTGTSNWSAAIAVQYELEKMTRPEELTGDEGIVNLDTRLLPIRLTLFPVEQLSLQLTSTHVRQTGRLQVSTGFDSFNLNERFWITDFSANYRILGRRGIIALGVSNLFDHKLNGFQELDRSNPRFALGRLAFARVTLQF